MARMATFTMIFLYMTDNQNSNIRNYNFPQDLTLPQLEEVSISETRYSVQSNVEKSIAQTQVFRNPSNMCKNSSNYVFFSGFNLPMVLNLKKWTSRLTLGTGGFPGDPHGRVGWGWGGVGDDNVLCTCTHGRCYATSWDGVGWGGVGDDNVPCTCTHGRCYATSSFLYLHTWSLIMGWGGVGWGIITFLALAHMVAATQHQLSCTCTHGRCYATSWDGVGWGGGW